MKERGSPYRAQEQRDSDGLLGARHGGRRRSSTAFMVEWKTSWRNFELSGRSVVNGLSCDGMTFFCVDDDELQLCLSPISRRRVFRCEGRGIRRWRLTPVAGAGLGRPTKCREG